MLDREPGGGQVDARQRLMDLGGGDRIDLVAADDAGRGIFEQAGRTHRVDGLLRQVAAVLGGDSVGVDDVGDALHRGQQPVAFGRAEWCVR